METFPYNPAAAFDRLIAELCRVLSKHAGAHHIEAPMFILIWNRFTRLAERFTRLVEQVRAGRFANPVLARSRGAAATSDRPRVAGAVALPRHRGWLVGMLPEAE